MLTLLPKSRQVTPRATKQCHACTQDRKGQSSHQKVTAVKPGPLSTMRCKPIPLNIIIITHTYYTFEYKRKKKLPTILDEINMPLFETHEQ